MTHLHINHRIMTLTWIALVWPEGSVPAAHQGSALLPPPAWCKSSHSLSGHMPWHTHCNCGTHATCTFTATILIDGFVAYPSNREVMRGCTSENTLSCESLGPYTLQEVTCAIVSLLTFNDKNDEPIKFILFLWKDWSRHRSTDLLHCNCFLDERCTWHTQ